MRLRYGLSLMVNYGIMLSIVNPICWNLIQFGTIHRKQISAFFGGQQKYNDFFPCHSYIHFSSLFRNCKVTGAIKMQNEQIGHMFQLNSFLESLLSYAR